MAKEDDSPRPEIPPKMSGSHAISNALMQVIAILLV
jgi:hypothetical protein